MRITHLVHFEKRGQGGSLTTLWQTKIAMENVENAMLTDDLSIHHGDFNHRKLLSREASPGARVFVRSD